MPLFACSRCLNRHPFEELSQGQQLCKECRGSFPVVKCTYCRSEFQQESKNSTAAVCKKCEVMVKQHGKPSACDYCNVIAAFIGNKCQRCNNAERKYGPPLTCEQCKQKCAFDRKDDERKKVDGKLLCWLCTLSYKRALAKTKVADPARHSQVKLANRMNSQQKEKEKLRSPHNKRPNRPDVTKIVSDDPPLKIRKSGPVRDRDPGSVDQLVLITELKEQITLLERQLTSKDTQLLNKDKQMTELKATHFTVEAELREKIKTITKEYECKIEILQRKIKDCNREIAQLSKGRSRLSMSKKVDTSAADGGSSGTDSPSVT